MGFALRGVSEMAGHEGIIFAQSEKSQGGVSSFRRIAPMKFMPGLAVFAARLALAGPERMESGAG